MRADKPSRTIRNARSQRREPSLPEALLWRHLRGSPSGHRIRRQHPAGPYVLDFFCARANLAIEIDGISHDMGDRPVRDEARDLWLREHRIETLRITAREVLANAHEVAEAIVRAIDARLLEIGKAPPSSLRDASCGPRATPAAPPAQVDGEG